MIFLFPRTMDTASAESGYFIVSDENGTVLLQEALTEGTQTVKFPCNGKAYEVTEVSAGIAHSIKGNEIIFILRRNSDTERFAHVKAVASEIEISLSCPPEAARLTGQTKGMAGDEIVFDVELTEKYVGSDIELVYDGKIVLKQYDGYHLVLSQGCAEITVNGLVENRVLSLTCDCPADQAELVGTLSGYENSEIVFDVKLAALYDRSEITVYSGGKPIVRGENGYSVVLTEETKVIEIEGLKKNEFLTLTCDAGDKADLIGTVSGYEGEEIVFDVIPTAIYSDSIIEVSAGGVVLERQSDGFHLTIEKDNCALSVRGLELNEIVYLEADCGEKVEIIGQAFGYENEEIAFDVVPKGIYSNSVLEITAAGVPLVRGSEGYSLKINKNNRFLEISGLKLNDYIELAGDFGDKAKFVGKTSGYEGEEFCFDVVAAEGYDRSEIQLECGGRELERGGDGLFHLEINASNSVVTVKGLQLNVYTVEVLAENGISAAVSLASIRHGEKFSTEITTLYGGVQCDGAILLGGVCSIEEVKDDTIVKLYYDKAGWAVRLFISGEGTADVYSRLTDKNGYAKFEISPAVGWKIADITEGQFEDGVLTVYADGATNVYVAFEKIEYAFNSDYPLLIIEKPAPLYYGSVVKFQTAGKVLVFLNDELLLAENDVYTVHVYDNIYLKTIDPSREYTVEYFDGDKLLKCDFRKPDEDYSLIVPEKKGYKFTGWSDGENTVESIDRYCDRNVKLYAVWQRIKVAITANFAGIKQVFEFYYGECAEIPTPVSAGKIFDGWYFEDGVLAIGSDGVNYANWYADAEIFAQYRDIVYDMPSDVYDGKDKIITVVGFDSRIVFYRGKAEVRAKNAGSYIVKAEIFCNGVKTGTDSFELTISPAELTVGAEDVSAVVGKEIAVAPVYSGFAEGEDEGALSKIPFVVLPDREGDYFLKFEGGEALNYSFVYKPFGFKLKTPRLDAKVDGGVVGLDCENGFCSDSLVTSAFSAPDKKLGDAAKKQLGGEVLGVLKLSVQNHDDGALVTLELDCLSGRKDVRAAYLSLDGSIYELDAAYTDGKISFRLPENSARYLIYVPSESNGNLSVGAIAGISAGCSAAIVLSGAGIFVIIFKKRRKKAAIG